MKPKRVQMEASASPSPTSTPAQKLRNIRWTPTNISSPLGRVLEKSISSSGLTTLTRNSPLNSFRINPIVGESFCEFRYLQSDRGTELRLVGLRKEGSPLLSQKMEEGLLVTRKEDLCRVDSIFVRGICIYKRSPPALRPYRDNQKTFSLGKP